MKKRIQAIPDEEPINEASAAKFLGITAKSLKEYVYRGKMEGAYTIDIIGKRWYFKSKLLYPHLQ